MHVVCSRSSPSQAKSLLEKIVIQGMGGALLLVRGLCSCDRADPTALHRSGFYWRGTYMGSKPGQLTFDPQQGSQIFMLLTIR